MKIIFLKAIRVANQGFVCSNEQQNLEMLKAIPNISTIKEFQEPLEMYSTIVNSCKVLNDTFKGKNPFIIMSVIHEIFGFTDTKKSSELREKYFNFMKRSGLIETKASDIDEFDYDPGQIINFFLNSNPDHSAIILGCGEYAKTYMGHGTCFLEPRIKMDHEKAIKIDINPSMGPDVISDIHSPKLWEGIVDSRLESVHDHTYGDFLFNDERSSKTLENIYRSLKPNGYINFYLSPDENNKKTLENAGFIITNPDESKKFYKK